MAAYKVPHDLYNGAMWGESWLDSQLGQQGITWDRGTNADQGGWSRQHGRAGTDEGWLELFDAGEGSTALPDIGRPDQSWLDQAYQTRTPYDAGGTDVKSQIYAEMNRLYALRDYQQPGYQEAGGDARLKQLEDFANQHYSSKGSMLSRFMSSPAFPLMAGVVGGGLAYDAGLFGGAGSLGAETGAGEMFGMTGMEGAAGVGVGDVAASGALGTGAGESFGMTGMEDSWLSEAVGAPSSASTTGWTPGPEDLVGGPGDALTGPTGPLSSSLSIQDFLKYGLPIAASGLGLSGALAGGRALRADEARLNAAFDRSDPFGDERKAAGDQYLEWLEDPSTYMSSPIARLQIDEMNREAQRKNAMLGQTWNVDQEGNIRGSGTGATEFAKQLQFNLAKQYEQALGNRAQQAGMSLFPSAEISRQLGSNAASQQGVRQDMYGNVIGLAGSLGNLYSRFFGA